MDVIISVPRLANSLRRLLGLAEWSDDFALRDLHKTELGLDTARVSCGPEDLAAAPRDPEKPGNVLVRLADLTETEIAHLAALGVRCAAGSIQEKACQVVEVETSEEELDESGQPTGRQRRKFADGNYTLQPGESLASAPRWTYACAGESAPDDKLSLFLAKRERVRRI